MDQETKQDMAPAIGAEWQGGIYAGLSIENNKPVALIVLPGEFNGNWKKATAWAAKQGGVLPGRVDLLILFQNASEQFVKDWYWSSEQYASDNDYAWCQGFSSGFQTINHKTIELRARAVRRLPV